MKKITALLLALALCLLAGCQNPNAIQMDLSRGYGEQLKLLHLNASTGENLQLMEAFGSAIQDAEPLDRDISLFAYYPDYLLELTGQEEGQTVTALIDLNGDYVDFIYPGPYPEADQVIYRSSLSAEEFLNLVNHVYE